MTRTLLIRHAIVVTVDSNRRVFFDGAVVVRGTRFLFVGSSEDALRYLTGEGLANDGKLSADISVIDGTGLVLFPGFISTHNHLYQTLLKGLGDDMVLADWLRTMTFPASRFITPEDTYHAAIIGLGEGVRSGITTNLDYMYPHPIEGLTDPIIRAYRETGVRAVIGRGGMDTGTEFGVDPGILQKPEDVERDLVRLFDTYHLKDDGKIRIWAAPAALWSNSEKMLDMLWRVTSHYKSGFTCHISETPFDRGSVVKKHGTDELTFLEKHGIVGQNVMLVHAVHLTSDDIRKAKQYSMSISHNTASNMYLSSGVAPVPAMLDAGLAVSLGVDGAASNNGQDMLELMKLTALLHKVSTLDPTIISAEKVLEMATIEGARALMMEDEIGSIAVGKRADFVVFDTLASPKSMPLHNPVSTLVYASTVQNIRDVYVDGEAVVENGRVMGIRDERAAYAAADSVAENLARRAGIDNRRDGHRWNERYRW